MGHLSLPHLEVVTRACPESHHFVIKTAKLPLLSSPNKISKPNRGFPNHQHQHWYIKTKRWQWMPLGFIMSYLHELSRGPKLISTPTPIFIFLLRGYSGLKLSNPEFFGSEIFHSAFWSHLQINPPGRISLLGTRGGFSPLFMEIWYPQEWKWL